MRWFETERFRSMSPVAVSLLGFFWIQLFSFTGASHAQCVGNCNNDADVTISEVQTCVNIHIGEAALSACQNADQDGDGTVSEIERNACIDSFLDPDNCPTVFPTPTRTETATATSSPTLTHTSTPTQTPTVTNTPVGPTSTPTNTFTSAPTSTNTPTNTATPSNTSTPTITPTITPTSAASPTNTAPAFTSFPMKFGPNSKATARVLILGLTLDLPLVGTLTLDVGQTTDANGVRPLRIRSETVDIDPVRLGFLGLEWACVRATGAALGEVDCNGGNEGINILAQIDHNTTPPNTCRHTGGGSGQACTSNTQCPSPERCNLQNGGGLPDDPECDDVAMFRGETDTPCREGDACNPGGPGHLGTCNSATVTTASGTWGAGAAQMLFNQSITLIGTGQNGPDGQPCTADDPVPPGNAVPILLTTGTATVRLFDANNGRGIVREAEASGAPLSCAAPQNGLTFGGGFAAIDVPGSVTSDIITTVTFQFVAP